jgi:hypothetical protein
MILLTESDVIMLNDRAIVLIDKSAVLLELF